MTDATVTKAADTMPYRLWQTSTTDVADGLATPCACSTREEAVEKLGDNRGSGLLGVERAVDDERFH